MFYQFKKQNNSRHFLVKIVKSSFHIIIYTEKRKRRVVEVVGLSWRRERQAFDVEGLPWGYIYTHTHLVKSFTFFFKKKKKYFPHT